MAARDLGSYSRCCPTCLHILAASLLMARCPHVFSHDSAVMKRFLFP